jgi:hypothetical protein
MFGNLKTTNLRAIDWCGFDGSERRARQDGSWTVKTPTGEMVGRRESPPMTGSTDKVDMIGAGYFGCAAMGP